MLSNHPEGVTIHVICKFIRYPEHLVRLNDKVILRRLAFLPDPHLTRETPPAERGHEELVIHLVKAKSLKDILSLVVNPEVFSFSVVISGIPVGTVSIVLIGVGFLLSFVFSNYEGSIVKSILASLTNIVSVLLGVVNVFSDIVSYIRLWAVGLAGAAIAATVNELAGPLLGNFLFMIIAIVLLVFGHGLNMILNVLSVIVHGIRLNTLEFSSHLDMSWSGHKFNPFKEQID